MKNPTAELSLSQVEPRAIRNISTVFVGDVMIGFPGAERTLPSRANSQTWQSVATETEWELWEQPPSTFWRGYPVIRVRLQFWFFLILGELYDLPQKETLVEFLEKLVTNETTATKLNGHFLLLGWNSQAHQWNVWTSRFGTLHAYHATGNQRAAIGTFFPAVAGFTSNNQLDWLGLLGFFTFGFFPQDRTYFENVRILRPAVHYVFDRNGLLISEKRYWDWFYNPDRKRSYSDTVTEFANILDRVISDQTYHGRIAIPISGGLDSRTTVASVTGSGVQSNLDSLWSYSYGYSRDSIETRIARQVAASRRLSFRDFTIGPYLFDRLDQVISCVEGFQDITQCRQAAVMNEVSKHADYMIAAHWGDVWNDDMGLVQKEHADENLPNYIMHKFKKKGSDWLQEKVGGSRFHQEELRTVLTEIIQEEMNRVRHIEDTDFRVKAFKTDQWSFRWTTTSLRAFQLGEFPRLPFYDTRMTDFFCTVPTEFVSKRRLQIDYLKRFAPDLSKIAWQVYDTNLYRYHLFNSLLLPKRAVKKGWRALTRKRNLERNWEVQFLNQPARKKLEAVLLSPNSRIHEFVAVSDIRELLQDFYSSQPDPSQGYTVSMLVTFAAWLEQYA
jgi:asparagine synthase (glutamine-hydrolysing)